MELRKALVCGAGGFIGSHLVKRLKGEGYWVRGVDLKLSAKTRAIPSGPTSITHEETEKPCVDA